MQKMCKIFKKSVIFSGKIVRKFQKPNFIHTQESKILYVTFYRWLLSNLKKKKDLKHQ